MIRTPEKLMPSEKQPKSAIIPIKAGTAPPNKTKAMGMVAVFLKDLKLVPICFENMTDAGCMEEMFHTLSLGPCALSNYSS